MRWARPGQGGGEAGFFALVQQVLVGPVAAFFMFTSSTGNIPLAAVLYSSGVAFAGVMAFTFSDLVVFPVLRVNAAYYGWKMALYIMGMLLASLVGTSLLMHGGLVLAGLLPEGEAARMAEQAFFKIDYTFFLNIAFLVISVLMAGLYWNQRSGGHGGGEIPGSAFVSSPTRTAPLSSTRFHLLRCPNSPLRKQPACSQ